MTTNVIPKIVIQELYSGNTFDGSLPVVDTVSGSEPDESFYRGRIQKWLGCTSGGKFVAPANIGMKVEQVFWNLDCAADPDVTVYLVDDNGVEYLVDSQSTTPSGTYVQTNDGLLVPPSFSLEVKSSQAISAVTAVAGEDTGVTGDGATATYAITFANAKVDKGTVSLVAGSVTFTDPGSDGVLVGAGGGGGSGTINYYTAAVSITLNTPSDFNGTNALATYDYNNIGRVGIIVNGDWGQPTFSQSSFGNESLPPSEART